jgi:hypothetical protein
MKENEHRSSNQEWRTQATLATKHTTNTEKTISTTHKTKTT